MDDTPADTNLTADAETASDARADRGDSPGSGFIDIRSALVGLGFIWLTAFAAFTVVLTVVYGLTVSVEYLLVSVGAGIVAAVAGRAALRTFGFR